MTLATSPDLLVGRISATGGRLANQNAMEVELCTAERALNQLLESDIAALPRTWGKSYRDCDIAAVDREFEVRIHQIRSTDVMADLLPSSRLDIRWPTIARLRDMGRLAAELWLENTSYIFADASFHAHHTAGTSAAKLTTFVSRQ